MMNKYIRSITLSVGCFLFAFCISHLFAQNSTENKKVPLVDLKGDGYARGIQHGKILKNDIEAIYQKWKSNISVNTKRDADSVLSEFYTATNFEPAIKKWTPEIYNEVKGIAEGSGQSFRDVFCFQLLDEFWVYLDKMARTQNHHCSGLGVAASQSHPAFLAQNLDVEGYMQNFQVLFHIAATKNEPEQYVLSSAGLVGCNGVNAKGTGVCVNTLMELEGSTDGLPVAFVVRGILSQKSAKAALSFVNSIKHASGQNYIVGTGDSIYNFEASANKVVRFIPDPGNTSLVYHTNHPMANDEIKTWYKARQERMLSGKLIRDNSYVRYSALKKRLELAPSSISEETIKETLRSKDDAINPICRPYNGSSAGFTFSSVIISLGKNPNIQLTHASPDKSEYVKYVFRGK